MRVSKQIEVMGEFWLPSSPKKKVPGVLTINSHGEILLEIAKDFFDIASFANNPQLNISLIHGKVDDLGFIRFVNCFYIRRAMTFSGTDRKSLLCANFVVCGVKYQKEEEITFSTFSFSVDCLYHWLNISGAEINLHDDRNVSIKYSCPKSIDIKLNEGMQIQIGFGRNESYVPSDEIKITQTSRIYLLSEKPKSLLYFVDMVRKINTFLCMAMDEIVCIKDVWATDPKNNKFNIYYQSPIYTEKIPAKFSDALMLFNFHSIERNAPAVFRKWIDNYEYLEPTYSLYLCCQMGDLKYVNFKFLSLVQSLENLRTIMHVLDGCSKPEFHLDQKLEKLIFTFENLIPSDSHSTWDKTIADIVGIRNYLTHYNDNSKFKEKAKNPRILYFLCEKMNAIIQLHFLRQSQFNDKEIEGIMNRCHELKCIFYDTERYAVGEQK